jgi:hypothetical protein
MTITRSYITNELFDAFLFCKYKSYLLLNNVDTQGNEYIELTSKLDRRFYFEAQQNLSTTQRNNPEPRHESLQPLNLYAGQDLLFDISITEENCHSQIDAVKRIPGKSKLGLFHYEPLIFYRETNTNKRSRLSLSYLFFTHKSCNPFIETI